MAYAVVRTDNMSGTIMGKDLVSLKFYNSADKEAAIENANVVLVGAYLDGEREVRKATAPKKNSALRNLAIVASEEVVKSKTYNVLNEFINETGSILRGYRLTSGDIFSATKEAFADSAVLAVGSIVEVVDGSTKMGAVKTATAGTTAIGTITAIEGKYYVVEVA